MGIELLALLAAAFLGYGLISRRAEQGVLTPAMFFTAIGVAIAAFGMHPEGGAEHETPHWLHTLAEIALALVLFVDASKVDVRELRRDHRVELRLLGIGLPLTIALGALIAGLVCPFLTLWEAALVGAILAPTDAALGQAVVSSPQVPERLRRTLNVESGLNDGIALPAVVILLCAASTMAGMGPYGDHAGIEWVWFTLEQVTLGPLCGIVIGTLGGKLVERASPPEGSMSESFEGLAALSLAWLPFAVAELIGGNGFLAAFTAGLAVGATTRRARGVLQEFGEAEGQLLSLLTFTAFGAFLVPPLFLDFQPAMLLYGLCSLTFIRMLPVALVLTGCGTDRLTKAFVGWFGPRGIASILFLLLVSDSVPHAGTVRQIVAWTVLLSVVAHGVTAAPFARRYGAREQAQGAPA
jgi:NhaP-type Na+/H+ or K+/H+ antiporter